MEALEAQKRIEQIRAEYIASTGENTSFSALIKGVEGSGKTRLAATGRLPILVDLFDPKGYVLYHSDPILKQLMEEKKIIVRFFTKEDSKNPTEYKRWETQWMQDVKSGFLKLFGTYVLDSGTSWMEAMANYIIRKKGGKRLYQIEPGVNLTGNLEIQDYQPIYNLVMDMIKMSSAQGCDFIYLAHLVRVPVMERTLTGELQETGRTITEMDIYNRLKSKVPKLFSEKYCMIKKPSREGVKHILLLESTGEYEASSQLKASGKLNAEEEPDLKKLLTKAGLPAEDKPLIW